MVWYWNPFEEMRRMREDMDRIFGGNLLLPETTGTGDVARTSGFRSALATLEERDEGFVVTTEIPGTSKEEIDLQVNPDSLVIKTERKEEREESTEGGKTTYTSYRGFYKVVGFPAHVDPEKATASYENGVLKVTVPRAADTKGRKLLLE